MYFRISLKLNFSKETCAESVNLKRSKIVLLAGLMPVTEIALNIYVIKYNYIT